MLLGFAEGGVVAPLVLGSQREPPNARAELSAAPGINLLAGRRVEAERELSLLGALVFTSRGQPKSACGRSASYD